MNNLTWLMDINSKSPVDDSINRTFWRYALPSIAAMLINGLFLLADAFFIGRYIGFEGLAGINMGWPIVFAATAIGLMIGMGAGSLLSINRGELQISKPNTSTEHGRTVLSSALILIVLFSCISSIALHLFSRPLLFAQGAQGQTLLYAQQYIDVFTYTILISILSAAIPILIRNDESPKIATLLMIVGAVANILFDYLFIVPFALGLQGAAIATVLAQLLVCIAGIFYLNSSRSSIKPKELSLKISRQTKAKIITLGMSTLFMSLYTSFVFAIHNHLFMTYGTSVSVAAFAIVGYLMTLFYLIAEGMGEGMQPPVSQYHGAQQQENIKKMVILTSSITLTTGVAWVMLLNNFPTAMITLFSGDDTALISAATTGIKLHMWALFLDGLIVIATMYFMAIDQAGKSLFLSVTNMVIQLPFLYILPKWLGVDGVWLAMPISNVVLFCIALPMVWRQLHKHNTHSTSRCIISEGVKSDLDKRLTTAQ